MTRDFQAPSPWLPDRPQALVVCCSDGRWHLQVEEFLQARVCRRADLLAIPGGPVAFDWWNASMDEARASESAFRLLLEHHDLKSVWLVAHQDCAYYRVRWPQLAAQVLEDRQREDLERVRRLVTGWAPHLEVHSVYAGLEGDRVVFRVV